MSKLTDDPRIDPRIKAIFGNVPEGPPPTDAISREQMLAEVNTPEAVETTRRRSAILRDGRQRKDRAICRVRDIDPNVPLQVRTATP